MSHVAIIRSRHSHGIGTVADDVAQAIDLRHPLLANVLEDHLQGFDVRVNITDEGPLHNLLPFRPDASTNRWRMMPGKRQLLT